MQPEVKLKIDEVKSWAKTKLLSSIEYLTELASIDSATLKCDEVTKVQQRLADTFTHLGMSVEFKEQHGRGVVLIARTRASLSSSADIALVGHADVCRDLKKPFLPVVIEGDVMQGPGVYDMKGGLVVIVDALKALYQMDKLDALPLRVIVNSAEEDPTRGVMEAMKQSLSGCSTALVFEFGRDKDNIVVERKGIVEAEVYFKGRASHAGNALWEGENALIEAFKLGLKLDALKNKERGVTCNPAKIEGGYTANTVPDTAQLLFEARFNSLADYEDLVEKLKVLETPENPKVQLTFNYKGMLPPMEKGPASEALFNKWQTAGVKAGLSFSMAPRVGGVSDGNVAAALKIPTLDGLGPRGGGAHEDSEHVLLSSLTPKTLNLIYFLCQRADEILRAQRVPLLVQDLTRD